ncbi:YceG family protein [Cytobacillus horneckiae]
MKNHLMPVTFETYRQQLDMPNSKRPMFEVKDRTLHFSQVNVRLLGLPFDEDEYFNALFDLVNNEVNFVELLSEDHLDKTMDNKHFQSIQKVLNINSEQNLSINRFVAFLEGDGLLLKSDNPGIHRKIREALMDMLKLFEDTEAGGLKSHELRRVLTDTIKWSQNHLGEQLTSANLDHALPKFLWYGHFKKTHFYFLFYLQRLGCDLIVVSPNGKDVFSDSMLTMENSLLHVFPNKKEADPFPTERRRRQATVAYRASREIETILNHEGSGLYKPWQLRDYTPESVTLKTTYDELFLLLKEKAMIRPNFEVKDGTVKIPAIFSKIQGVSKNRKEYWDRLHTIVEYENCLMVQRFPFSNSINNDFRYHYRNSLDRDGLPDPQKMLAAHYWKFNHLPNGLQNGIAMAIRHMCEKPLLKALSSETEEDLKTYLFAQSMQIPPKMIQLFQKFDYSQEVPKFIIYNNELDGIMARTDAVLLLLLNQFGVDIIIYNPAGHNDVENYLDERLYDTHWLEDVVFEQNYKEPSILKNAITKIFKKF